MSKFIAPVALIAVATAFGCGDGPICESEIVIAISGPLQSSELSNANDVDATEPGIQIAVEARSNLKEGDTATLTITHTSSGAVEIVSATSDSDGNLTFSGITLPAGNIDLTVHGISENGCGEGTDSVQVFVVSDVACDLLISNGPVTTDFYAPLGVLNQSNDGDTALPNFQATVVITTAPDLNAELFVLDVDTGAEASIDIIPADANGRSSFDVTLGQGRQAIRATCVSTAGGANAASATNTVFVDTVAPETCALTFPADGSSVTPDDDTDPAELGIQLLMIGTASASDNDVGGQPGTFIVGGAATVGSNLDGNAESTGPGVFGSPGDADVGFVIDDYAGNTCSYTGTVNVDLDGCAIVHVSPAAGSTLTADADTMTAGFQADIVVNVDASADPVCAGVDVMTDCGNGGSATVVAGVDTSMRITIDNGAPSEGSVDCQSFITHPSGFVTFAPVTFDYDNQPPGVALDFVAPTTLDCGMAVTDAVDVDSDLMNGVQIDVRLLSANAFSSDIEVTNSSTLVIPSPNGQTTRITLEVGSNNIVALARDDHGNEARSQDPCDIPLVDIAMAFSPPVDDGLVGGPDDVSATAGFQVDICGTVSEPTATVQVSLDGGMNFSAATVPGDGTWCLSNQTLTEASYDLVAESTLGARAGVVRVTLVVDLTGPDAPTGLDGTVENRHAVAVTWTSADNGGSAADAYIGKSHTVALDEATFDANGAVFATPTPQAAGNAEAATVEMLNAGTEYHFAVAAVDAAGNRSLLTTFSSAIPDFDATGEIQGPEADGNTQLHSFAQAAGDLNDDGFSDIVIGAPGTTSGGNDNAGAVHIYFGSDTGISTSPDVTIGGAAAGDSFGYSVTVLDWDGDDTDDLAVGAPFASGFQGGAYIFIGGTTFSPAATTDAGTVIGAGSTPGWFALGVVGQSADAGDFDGDGRDDLILGAPGGGASFGVGGAVVVYGGSTETTIGLSDSDATDMGAAVAHIFENPIPANNLGSFGWSVFNLGRTEGTADGNDDFAISYQADAIGGGVANAAMVYIIRGRSTKPTGPAAQIAFDSGRDLRVQNIGTGAASAFGEQMGSIADQNGDGVRDIMISAFRQSFGRVTLIDGSAVGNQVLTAIDLTTFRAFGAPRYFGVDVLNNARSAAPDINNDGVEDVVILGGIADTSGGTDVSAYVWYGGSIPTGTINITGAGAVPHTISDPGATPSEGFQNFWTIGQPGRVGGIWAGDTNGDGLEDICWGDFALRTDEGSFEVLWDDPNN